MSISKFNIAIVGGGVSGLHLALALNQDSYFKDYSIVLFEKSPKNENDKTWSFWEEGNGNWDKLISKQWKTAKIFAQNKEVNLTLAPYTYKMLRSIDFYNYAYTALSRAKHIKIIYEEVIDLKEKSNSVNIQTASAEYEANLIFNSKLPNFEKLQKEADYTLLQHFKGWFIETKEDVFNPNEFSMMDYRFKDRNSTSFMYVLPTHTNKALVEFTYFTPELVSKSHYDSFLKKYIQQHLKVKDFKILEQEYGIIPMTTYPFAKNNTKNIIHIGTAGGWVKASSGYSFKIAEKKANQITLNLKQNLPATQHLFQKKYSHYDSLFLDVLYHNNSLGEKVFYKLYAKNKTKTLLRFLDEESSFTEDLSIISSLTSFKFIRAFFKHISKF